MIGASGQIDDLPPLRDVIDRHGLDALKALGQNFLLDLNLTSRIARTAGDRGDHDVIEIGPGPGGLTRALLANGARRVIAVERDRRCLPALAEIAEHYPGRLEVIEGDALKADYARLASKPVRIVANLPYNIATPLLTGWVGAQQWPPYWSSLTLMFQKEVAERICAAPGDKTYGRLAILCQWRCECELAFEVGPKAFTPPPKVTSAIVSLIPRAEPLACDVRRLETVTAAAFGQRRKMLRSSLRQLGGQSLLDKAGIDGERRAETLSVAEFVTLANIAQSNQ
ncbi:MAG: 16S rRNA (adenine(1518)-N(6)/adenine(1519)-N(6))-dimethyltransferase RsmA [Rhizobiaceae bacterium]